MRVIAGALKGRRLRSPKGSRLRPTSDRLRETLFNILGYRVESARVLDACAGTGALGIEALSRGAARVVFVDRDRRASLLIAENIEHCGVTARSAIVQGVLPGVENDPKLSDPFDLVLVDPPYDDPQIGAILSAAATRLEATGTLVLERSKRTSVPTPAGLVLVRSVKTGDSVLDFYHWSKGSPTATR